MLKLDPITKLIFYIALTSLSFLGCYNALRAFGYDLPHISTWHIIALGVLSPCLTYLSTWLAFGGGNNEEI